MVVMKKKKMEKMRSFFIFFTFFLILHVKVPMDLEKMEDSYVPVPLLSLYIERESVCSVVLAR